MSDLPAWAMEKARDLDSTGCGCNSEEEAAKCEFMTAFCQRSRIAIARALVAERAAERERCTKWLNSMPQNWELVCENEDKSDLSSDLVWVVYTVTGGLNDRECNTLGTGDTPSNALSAAFLAAAIRNQEPER